MSSSAYLESRILAADPIELVHILFEHAILSVRNARLHLGEGDILARSKAVSKAIAIIGELDSSLDHKNGGSLSQEFARLYDYVQVRLTEGNFAQKDAPLAEAEKILCTLADGWSTVKLKAEAADAPQAAAQLPEVQWDRFQMPEPESGYAEHTWSA